MERNGSQCAQQEKPQERVISERRRSAKNVTDNAEMTNICPGPNKRAGPSEPQITEAVAKFPPDGQKKPLTWVGVQMSAMFANAQFCTRATTKQLTKVATTWPMNMVRGGIFI